MNNKIAQPRLIKSFLPDSLERGKFWLVFLVILFSSWWSVGQSLPDYSFAEGRDLDEINVTVADVFSDINAKLNRIILAVDVNSQGDVFVLTFGNGIKKVRSDGELINFIPNTGNLLSSPMDFAINSEDKFYVATNESDLRFVRVFSPTGEYLQSETLGDGSYGTGPNNFKGPTGLAFDKEDKLYIADHYTGDMVQPKPSAIKIYQKNNAGVYKNNLLKEFDNVEGTLLQFPYRLAVNSQGLIYLAESGENDNAKVKIIELDANLEPDLIGEIVGNELGNPGSIIIDNFDYAFIADFGDKVSFTDILEASSDPFGMIEVFEDIKEGIENNIFNINIYNPNRTFRNIVSDEIDFVIDLAISNCGDLNVNNGNFYGTTEPLLATDVTFDFDLEIYTRSPGYDTEDPVIACQENIEVTADEGEDFAVVEFDTPTAEDNCSEPIVDQTRGEVSGSEFSVGDHVIEFTATDAAGNESTCTFTITVNPSDEGEEPATFENCPSDIINTTDAGECGAIVTFDPPTASDGNGTVEVNQTEGPASGDLFPLNTTRVTFEATGSDGTTVKCSFTVTVNDEEGPAIDCPSDITESANSGEDFAVVEFGIPSADDNCSATTVIQTGGLPSGSEFPLGDHDIEFTATDEAGNDSSCTFTITVTPADEEEPVKFVNCPSDIVKTTDAGECGAIVAFDPPTASDGNGTVEVNQTEGPGSGDFFPGGTNNVVFEATGSDGTTVTCSFTVTVNDEEDPVANCVAGFEIELNSNGTASISADDINNGSSDNCGIVNMEINKTSFTTADLGENTIELSVTDAAGNISTCETIVTIIPNDPPPPDDFACKEQYTFELGANGEATLTAEDLYTGDPGNRKFTLSKSDFTCADIGNATITLSYSGDDGDGDCEITVEIKDTFTPQVRTQDIAITLDGQGQAILTPEMVDDGTTDNCGEIELSLDKTVFTCKDLGGNQVVLSAEDENGNTATATANVTVVGQCEQEPPGKDVDYIYVYPNPTPGPFRFAVPQNVEIEKVEVYDIRGRFMLAKEFVDNQDYSMNLTGLQRAVYVLKVFTTSRIETLRIIVY